MSDSLKQDEERNSERIALSESRSRDPANRFKQRLGGWRQRRYRIGIISLAALGTLMGVAGIVIENSRTVLFALSGIGLFGAILSYMLVPERFIPTSLAWRTYAPLAEIGPLLVTTFGLSDRQVYFPTDNGRVRLLIPESSRSLDNHDIPSTGIHESDGARQLVLPTTGDELLAAFREQHDEALQPDAEKLIDQLLDVLVEDFELIGWANAHIESESGRAVVAVEQSYYGRPTTFDHPVAAFLAAGFVAGLGTAVVLAQTQRSEDGQYVLTYHWNS
jgi:hypothetical protein